MRNSKGRQNKKLASPSSRVVLIFILLVLMTLGTIYSIYTWNSALKETEHGAIQLAEAAEAGIQKTIVAQLIGNINDIDRPEYIEIKNTLVSIANLDNDIRFTYILIQKDNKIYFVADSEPADSEDYSPPGQEYTEADEQTYLPFKNGQTLLTEPSSDRWGTWVSVFVPMFDSRTGEVIAVFGVDYPTETWYSNAVNHIVQAIITVICIILIFAALYLAVARNKALRREKFKLEELSIRLDASDTLFRTVFEQAPIGIAIGLNYNLISKINSKFESILGRDKKELSELSWVEFTHPDDLEEDLENFRKFKSGEIDGYCMPKRFIKPDGSVVWVNMTIAHLMLKNSKEKNPHHLCLIENITDRIKNEKELSESERSKAVLLSHIPGMAYRCSCDHEWTMQFVSEGCFALTGYKADMLLNNNSISYCDIIASKYRDLLWAEWERVLEKRESFRYEYEIITASGERKWVLELGQGIFNEKGKVEALEGIVIDITEQKNREAEIKFMLRHDHLTGLFNRKHYEDVLKKYDRKNLLPLSLIMADINGVRLINDAFGYAEGDKLLKETATILKSCCRPTDILARTGGDEFGIIVPNTDADSAYEMINAIQKACEEYNKNNSNLYELNLSIGFATKEDMSESIDEVAKSADEYLRNQKLLNRNSFHSEIVASIMSTMYEKSEETEEHAKRLADITKKIGEKLKLPQKALGELELFSMLHDIGKVGIDDRILKKPGKLTDEEWAVMKTHCEIGYRIAKSVSELEPIADYILTHHERWDGRGYPQGLKGETIPLLSRILAVTDTYDAMTNDRVYRKALSKEIALEEIKRNNGTQFDPQVVEVFKEVIVEMETAVSCNL